MPETPLLGLPLIAADQAQKHVTHNEALAALDAIVQLAVKDKDLVAPPASPAEGDRYIVPAGATGAWAGQTHAIACRQGGAWVFHPPREGWRAWVDDENALCVFDGSAWVDVSTAMTSLQNLAMLGIGTSADATNPFSAKLNNALWAAKTVAEGGDGDLRSKMSKATAGDTLSLLLQDNFSGRAELGLIGDDDFTLKVSPDGSAWVTAMIVDKDDGVVALPAGLAVDTSTLVVKAADDQVLMGLATARANIANSAGTATTPAFQRLGTGNNAAGFAFIAESASPTTAPSIRLCKGDAAGGAPDTTGDRLGELAFSASDGTNYLMGALIRGLADGVAFATNVVSGRLEFHTNHGSAGPTERLRIDKDGVISHRANAQVLFDANSHLRLRSYTVGTLPLASGAAGQAIWCSDLGGGAGPLVSDGTTWKRLSETGVAGVSSDANFTLTPLSSAPIIRHTGTLTADRTVSLSASGAYAGARFHIARSGGGAFNLAVGSLKLLATNQWATVEHDGAGWVLVAAGSL